MSQRATVAAPAPARTVVARAVAPVAANAPLLSDLDAGRDPVPGLHRLPPGVDGGFARLPVGTPLDADARRDALTRQLLAQLAPALGIDPARLRVEVNAAGRARLDAAGAHGLQEGTTIWLHPAHYRPGEPSGRELLAHEAAHAAQRALTGWADPAAAEAEARSVGRAFAAGRLPRHPRVPLRQGRAAASEEAQAGPPASVGVDRIQDTRAQELAVMTDALDGLWVSDGDVSDVLRVMEPLAFPTQVLLVQGLDNRWARRLADNISDVHFQRYRPSILAAYLALARRGQADALEDDPFGGMDWTALAPAEHFALREIIPAFRALPKGAAWYARLKDRHLLGHVGDVLDNVPDYDEAAQSTKAAEEERLRARQLQEDRKLARRDDVKGFLEKARDRLSYKPLDWAVTDGDARSLIDEVARFAGDTPALRAIVDTLEGEGLMDRWVSNVPASDLMTDALIATPVGAAASLSRRKMLLKLLVLRPAWKNSRMAEELLSRGLFDWAITDEDAFLAAQLVKALPEQVRAGFFAEGDNAARLDAEQSLSMKKGLAANEYGGGADGSDLRSIQAQLLDDTLWTMAQQVRLRGLVRMARAADEARWVFDLSRQRFLQPGSGLPALYADADFFEHVVQAFALYVPKGFRRADGSLDPGRPEYVPERLEGKPFFSDNFLASIAHYVGFLVDHTGHVGIHLHAGLRVPDVHAVGLDFAEAQQTQDGTLSGAEFKAARGDTRDEQLENSLDWYTDAGLLDLNATRLEIADINYPLANLKVQTGAVTLRGLRLHLAYPTERSQHKTTTLRLHVESLQLDDVLLVGADSMRSFERVRVRGLFVQLAPDAGSARIASLPESLASGAVALLRQGLLAPTTPLDLVATAAEVLLEGMTTSDGQFVAHLRLEDLVLRAKAPPKDSTYRQWLSAEHARLQARLTASLQAAPTPWPAFEDSHSLALQLRSIEHEQQGLAEAEADAARLAPLVDGGRASAADAARYKRVQAYLAGVETGGVAIDLGHGEARGIAGKVAMGDVSLDDVHGWGHSAGAVLGTLGGSATLNRTLRGPGYRGTLEGVELEGDPAGFVKLGDLRLAAVDVQGDIPTAEVAARDLADARAAVAKNRFDPALADEVLRLEARARNATVYWSTLQRPAVDPAGRQAFNEARTALLADRAFHADSLSARGAVLELGRQADGATGVGLDTQAFDASGLEAGGVRVASVHADNLRLGADVGGGLRALAGLGRNRHALQGATISADTLRLRGIAHKYSGVQVAEVLVEALDAHAGLKDGRSDLGVSAARIDVQGIDWSLSERLLEMQRAKLVDAAATKKPTAAEAAQLRDIEALLDDIRASKASLAEAVAHLADPKLLVEGRRTWEERRREAEGELALWQKKVALKRLTVRDLSLDVQGLGDVLADDWSLGRALGSRDGIRIGSGRPDGRIASGISLQGASARTSPGSARDTGAGTTVTAGGHVGVESLETGPIRGSVTLKADSVSIDDFGIDSLALQGISYAGGGIAVWTQGKEPCQVTGVKLSATLETPLVDAEKPDGDRYAAALQLREFRIGRIAAAGLHYRSETSGLRVALASGRLEGVYATDTRIELPRTDADALLVKGGNAGFARTRNLQLAVATGSGMALGTSLQTGSLAVAFAHDGKVTADLQKLEADAGRLTQKDLDVWFAAKTDNLHVELSPGSRGYENGRQLVNARGVAFAVDGKQGGNRFKASGAGIDTGDVVREPDGSVHAAALSIPLLSLDSLHLATGDFVVDVPDGSPIVVQGLAADIVAHANPKPEAERGKDESAFSRIVIRKLTVPLITTRGLKLTLPDAEQGDIVLSQSADDVGILENLTVGGQGDKDEGFVIEPNANWQMFGKVGLTQATLGGIGADLRSVLVDSVHADVTGISVGFFGSEDTVFGFDEATLRHLSGSMVEPAGGAAAAGGGPAAATALRLKKAGFKLAWTPKAGLDSKIVLHGFRHDKAGSRLQAAELKGLRYTIAEKGLKLDINSASVPAGKDGAPGFTASKNGLIRVGHAQVDDADLEIDDVQKLAGDDAAASADGGPSFTPGLDVLNHLSGHLAFTATPFARGFFAGIGVYLAGPFGVRIEVVDGTITLVQLTDSIKDLAVSLKGMKLGTLLQALLKGKKSAPPDPATDKQDAKPKSGESFLSSFFFGDVDIHLTLPGQTRVTLGTAGFLELAGSAGSSAVVLDVTSTAVPAIKASVPRFQADVGRLQLALDNKGTTLKTGAIHIGGVKALELFFTDQGVGTRYVDSDGNRTQNELPLPQRLKGTITDCSVDDVELQLAPDARPAKGTP